MATNISGSGDSTFGGTIQSTGIDDNATSTKLTTTSTGIDVTGTVTADGLNLDASVNYPIRLENQAGSTADGAIGVFDDASGTLVSIGSNFYVNNAGAESRFNTGEEASGIVLNRTGNITARTSDGTNNTLARLNIANNGDISFYEDTGTTPKFFWDASAERLGIGTTASNYQVHITSRLGIGASGFNQQLSLGNNSIQSLRLGTGYTSLSLNALGGNVGIGTSSPSAKLDLQGASAGAEMLEITHSGASQPWKFISGESGVTNEALIINRGASGEWMRFHAGAGTTFSYDGTTRMRIDSSGNLKFDSGYGSAATAYGCRAWVNFRGTGTVAIRASGNASSITDNGAGDYTLNFSTTFPDNSFACVGITNTNTGDANRPVVICNTNQTPSSVTIESVGTHNNNTNIDCGVISISVFR